MVGEGRAKTRGFYEATFTIAKVYWLHSKAMFGTSDFGAVSKVDMAAQGLGDGVQALSLMRLCVPQDQGPEFPGGLVIKDPVLSMLWLGSLLWCGFDSWPWNLHMPQPWPKKKKKKKKKKKIDQASDTFATSSYRNYFEIESGEDILSINFSSVNAEIIAYTIRPSTARSLIL